MDDFTLSSVRCVSSEEALRAPAPDGSFRMGGIQWGQGKELAANATLLPGDTPQCKGDIDTVRTIAKTIAMRVPHGYVDAEDITTASYDPMGAILRHRDHERVGMCGTRAALLVLELARCGVPSRVAQIQRADGSGHVIGEAWVSNQSSASWLAVDPSRGRALYKGTEPVGVAALMSGTGDASVHWERWFDQARGVDLTAGFQPDPAITITWPEPWLVFRKGSRPWTLFRSSYVMLANPEYRSCAGRDLHRVALVTAMIIGLVTGVVSLRPFR